MFKMTWFIPDPIDVVETAPYGDDMTVSFEISGQSYTLQYRTLRQAQADGADTNIEIMEWVLRQPQRFALARYIPAPKYYPPGFIYVVPR